MTEREAFQAALARLGEQSSMGRPFSKWVSEIELVDESDVTVHVRPRVPFSLDEAKALEEAIWKAYAWATGDEDRALEALWYVADGLVELDTVASVVGDLDREVKHLRLQRDELQASNTSLVTELRAVDQKRMVREFFAIAGQTIGERPRVPDDETVRFRLRLIVEETWELLAASFGGEQNMPQVLTAELHKVIDNYTVRVDLVELVDAAMDILYVVHGLCIAFGVDVTPVFAEVQRSNLAKLGGPKRASDGKLLRPATGWVAPDIAGCLEKQGWQR